MLYGCYQNARNGAWKCLIDYRISSLPVNLIRLARDAGIEIRKDSARAFLSPGESGAAMLIGGVWCVFYDGAAPPGHRRFTLAHEFGHIFLGHPLTDTHHGRAFDKNKPLAESEADMFAARLLAPACVLWGLNLRTPEDIAAVCGLSRVAAAIRSTRMALLRQRGKFLTSPLERQVYAQFKAFIEERRK